MDGSRWILALMPNRPHPNLTNAHGKRSRIVGGASPPKSRMGRNDKWDKTDGGPSQGS